MTECCENCGYYDLFSGVCCNANSQWMADFTNAQSWCKDWGEDVDE